jgi:hypothetical protein
MLSSLPQSTSHQNVRVVPVEPKVKSDETCKLFNVGAVKLAGSAKSVDPIVYNACVGWETSAAGCLKRWSTIMAITKAKLQRFVRTRNKSAFPSNLQFYSDAQECGFDLKELGDGKQCKDFYDTGEYHWQTPWGRLIEYQFDGFKLKLEEPSPLETRKRAALDAINAFVADET